MNCWIYDILHDKWETYNHQQTFKIMVFLRTWLTLFKKYSLVQLVTEATSYFRMSTVQHTTCLFVQNTWLPNFSISFFFVFLFSIKLNFQILWGSIESPLACFDYCSVSIKALSMIAVFIAPSFVSNTSSNNSLIPPGPPIQCCTGAAVCTVSEIEKPTLLEDENFIQDARK